jgi:hypothetical protein
MTPLAALLLLLVRHELIDPREARYADTATIAARVKSLHDTPHVWEHQTFAIPRSAANDAVALNRSMREHWRSVAEIHGDHVAAPRLASLDWRYDAWDLLRDAKCDYYYTHVRREALAKLRRLLGTEAFERGVMPQPIPQEYRR